MKEITATDVILALNSRARDYTSGVPHALINSVQEKNKEALSLRKAAVTTVPAHNSIMFLYASNEIEDGRSTEIGDKEINFLFEIISKGLKLDPKDQIPKMFEIDSVTSKDKKVLEKSFQDYVADVENCLEVHEIEHIIVLSSFLSGMLQSDLIKSDKFPGFAKARVLYATDLAKISSDSKTKKEFWSDLQALIKNIS